MNFGGIQCVVQVLLEQSVLFSTQLFFSPMLQVYEAIDTRDGASCAELVSFKHPHVANPRLQVCKKSTHTKGYRLSGFLREVQSLSFYIADYIWQCIGYTSNCVNQFREQKQAFMYLSVYLFLNLKSPRYSNIQNILKTIAPNRNQFQRLDETQVQLAGQTLHSWCYVFRIDYIRGIHVCLPICTLKTEFFSIKFPVNLPSDGSTHWWPLSESIISLETVE